MPVLKDRQTSNAQVHKKVGRTFLLTSALF